MKYFFVFLIFFNLLLSKELDDVTLYLKWKHQFQFAGFYIAKEKGYYEEAGLKVDIKEPTAKSNLVEKVLKDENVFAISDSSLINNIMRGDELSLLMTTFQQAPNVFLYLKNNDMKNNSAKNIKIMLDINESENPFIKFYLQKNNLNGKSLKFLQTSYNINDLINGKTDIYMLMYQMNLFF